METLTWWQVREWGKRWRGFVCFFFFFSVCWVEIMCRYTCAAACMWRSEDTSGVAPQLGTEPLVVNCCVRQSRRPWGFWGFSCLCPPISLEESWDVRQTLLQALDGFKESGLRSPHFYTSGLPAEPPP